ncbi:50S ribosomal protein L14 [Patescibacteria group bacterium]|nr:50S ribosomal protein L14 [Patescibacteria group bacterium]MBU1867876.1 50S ribosomal protein L14 [Patescibacteria group bacterium]
MIQPQSYLNVADNSGARTIMCLSIPGYSKKKYGRIGDTISAVVKTASPNGTVSSAQIVRALIVRTRKETRRKDGSYVRFDDNAAVIVDKKGNPIGTRILGPIAREIKDTGHDKIASMAPEIV